MEEGPRAQGMAGDGRSRARGGLVTGINPGKSHGQGPWVSYRKHMLDDKLVGKQEDTFLLDILMTEVRFTVDAKVGVLRARVTDDVGCLWRCPS